MEQQSNRGLLGAKRNNLELQPSRSQSHGWLLATVLHSQLVSDDELSTLLAEVEGILNSRPLVPIVIDPEGNEPLTPNHLLLLRGNPNLPPGLFEKRDSYAKRRWAQVQYLVNQFWVRWVREFLPGLNQRVK